MNKEENYNENQLQHGFGKEVAMQRNVDVQGLVRWHWRSNAGLLDDIITFEVNPEHFSGANTAMQVPDRVQTFLNSSSRLE